MEREQFKRVEELFDAALEVPADQRQRFLERACGPDTKLLETVERLLRHVGPGADPPTDSSEPSAVPR